MDAIFYDERYKKQLIQFIDTVWEKGITEESFENRRIKNLIENPYVKKGGFPTAIVLKKGKIIGHHAGTPYKLWVNGKEHLAYWLAGLHVLPEGRRQGLAKKLQNRTNELPVATSFWVVEATLRVKKKMGWTIPGKIPEFVYVVDAKTFIETVDFSELGHLPRILKRVYRLILQSKITIDKRFFSIGYDAFQYALAFFNRSNTNNYSYRLVDRFDQNIDELWEHNKKYLKFAQVRKSDYLNWQFSYEDGWRKIVVKRGDRFVGYAIVSIKQLDRPVYLAGLKTLSIIDIFWDFDQPNVVKGLIAYVKKLAVRQNVSVIICSINEKKARSMLLRAGFIPIEGTVYFGFHCNDEGIHLSPDINDWFITRGDGDAAGSLGPKKELRDLNE